MTLLGYSGRGRDGGRGRGHGRGRGGGRGRGRGYGYRGGHSFHHGGSYQARSAPPAISTKWVRPKDNSSAAVESSSLTQSNKEHEQGHNMAGHHHHHSLTKKGHNKLILKTREASNQNSVPSSSNTLDSSIRSVAGSKPDTTSHAESVDKSALVTTATRDGSMTSAPGNESHASASKGKREPAPSEGSSQVTQATMERRGRNQLILKTTGGKSQGSPTRAGQILQRTASNDGDDPGKKDSYALRNEKNSMRRLGHHKLVLKNNDQKEEMQMLDQNVERKGTASSGYNNTTQEERKWNRNSASNTNRSHWSKGGTSGKAPFRRNYQATRGNSAKRIKLTIQPSASIDDDDDDDGPTNQDTNANNPPKEKLTDFAYRETAPNRKGRYHQQHHQQQQRNMGLVRVQPNVKKTPICPTFLRGVECTDTYCRKRHDVPKEFAIPICSFFQRRGECLKGDECVFRHVKVNPRAMICPSFSLLGFCDDESCSMKHMREKKPHL